MTHSGTIELQSDIGQVLHDDRQYLRRDGSSGAMPLAF